MNAHDYLLFMNWLERKIKRHKSNIFGKIINLIKLSMIFHSISQIFAPLEFCDISHNFNTEHTVLWSLE